jgi:hypothetical protein
MEGTTGEKVVVKFLTGRYAKNPTVWTSRFFVDAINKNRNGWSRA